MSLYDKLKTGIIGGGGLALGKIFSLKPIDGNGDFIANRASDGTRRNSAGVIVTEPTNMPRADYKFGRTCPAILSEPLSQNLIPYSEDFGQSDWTKNGVSIKSTSIISPNGGNSLLLKRTGSGLMLQNVPLQASEFYTYSVFYKAFDSEKVRFELYDGSTSFKIDLNPQNNEVTVNDSFGYNIESFNNGWYRIKILFQTSASTNPISSGYWLAPDRNNEGKGVYIYGAQLEQSSFPTSYMATAGGVTTRQPDIIEQLQATTESFNSPKGTIFLKMASITTDDEERKISFFGDPNDNEIRIRYYNQGIGVRMIVDGVNVASFSTQQLDQTPFRNIAFNWDETSCSFWVDGEQIGSATLTESYPEDTLLFCSIADSEGTNQFRGWLEELSVYDNNDIDMEDLTDYNTFEIMANNLNYIVQ